MMNCYEDEKNASKRLANWKSVNVSEKVAPAINSGNKIEYLLCDMCFPSNVELLNDLNRWIANTAATMHSTLHNVGFKEPKEASTTDLVTMGNSTDVSAKMIVQLSGVICDKQQNELQDAMLDDVSYLPDVKYNLFSLSKMTRHGRWKLGSNKDALWIEK